MARPPYELVKSLAQGLPEPSDQTIISLLSFSAKLIGKELVVVPIVTSAEKEMLKRGANKEPQTEKTYFQIKIKRNNFRVPQ